MGHVREPDKLSAAPAIEQIGEGFTNVGVRTGLHTGDIITVGGVDYRMASSTLVLETQLPADSNVWANIPGRLIVITCLENADGSPSRQNLIITATGL